jgi:hypothetical protein
MWIRETAEIEGERVLINRMVLAGLLGLHHRVDWKACSQTDEEEKEDAVKFKKAFQPFAPK